MRRSPRRAIPFLLAVALQGVSVEPASGEQALDDKELLGMRLFNQSCRVCHTKPQMRARSTVPNCRRIRWADRKR